MTGKVDRNKSTKLLDEIERRKNQKKIIRVEEKTIKLVVFTILEHYFAFLGNDIKGILPIIKVNFVPGSPEYILGIINVRGDIESVLDIHSLLGFRRPTKDSRQRIILAEKNNIRSGILVDSVEDVLDVPKSSVIDSSSTLNETTRDFVVGQTNYKSQSTTIVDVEKIFAKVITQ